MDIDDNALFAAFDAPSAPAWAPPKALKPASSASPPLLNDGPAEKPADKTAVESASAISVPVPFNSMERECLATVSFSSHIDPVSRRRIEEAFRSATVAHTEELSLPQAEVVHYFQAFTADYTGAASATAAAALPRPKYDRLCEEALPRAAKSAAPRRRQQGFQGRYYDAPAPESKPGVLSAELRRQLGIGPNDPPPYLSRMLRQGFPPGYLGDPAAAGDAGSPTQLQFIADAMGGGESLAPTTPAPGASRHVPLVNIPGLNVPPPPTADPVMWGWRGPIAPPAPFPGEAVGARPAHDGGAKRARTE